VASILETLFGTERPLAADAVLEVSPGSALVVRKGKLVGIFTVTDACRVLGEILKGRFDGGDDDVA